MARDWETLFRNWSGPSSDTEETKCENATRMIRGAVSESTHLARYDIDTFAQGSYRNNTNVRQDSDVDICVCRTDIIHFDFSHAPGLTIESVGFSPLTFSHQELKQDLLQALVDKFDYAGVTRGSKAFDVHANSYRVDADVVPALKLRLYYANRNYDEGTFIRSDSGHEIYNFPKQQYENGVVKNRDTGGRFKKIVRAMKRLRNEMAEENEFAAKPIPSFLIECLAYNVPDAQLSGDSFKQNVKDVISTGFHATASDDSCKNWLEVSELKWLFRPGQPWTSQQVNSFLRAAWNYAEFG